MSRRAFAALLVFVVGMFVVSLPVDALSSETKTFVFLAKWSPSRIFVLEAFPDGSFGSFAEFAAPGDGRDLAIGPEGLFLYFAGKGLTRFAISQDTGALTLVETVRTDLGVLDDFTFSADGRFLYASTSLGSVVVFELDPEDPPTLVQEVTGFVLPHGVALSADESYLYVANRDVFLPEIFSFARSAGDGTLALAGMTSTLTKPDYIVVQNEDYLYFSQTTTRDIVSGEIGAGGASVTAGDGVESGPAATQLLLLEDRLYSANRLSDEIVVFEADPANGMLLNLQSVPAGDVPEHMAKHPSEPLLYSVASNRTELFVYEIDVDGFLTPVTIVDPAIFGGYRLAVGQFRGCAGLPATIYVEDDVIVGGPNDGLAYPLNPLFGGRADDVIVGTALADPILGQSGMDRICAGGGDDFVSGGAGNDVIVGGEGDDTLLGDADDDVIDGGPGVDVLFGGSGADVLFGNAGNDTLLGEDGDDVCDGGADFDGISGGPGTDTCLNGEGVVECEL